MINYFKITYSGVDIVVIHEIRHWRTAPFGEGALLGAPVLFRNIIYACEEKSGYVE